MNFMTEKKEETPGEKITSALGDIFGRKVEDIQSVGEILSGLADKASDGDGGIFDLLSGTDITGTLLDTFGAEFATDIFIFFLPEILDANEDLKTSLQEALNAYFDRDEIPITRDKLSSDSDLKAKITVAGGKLNGLFKEEEFAEEVKKIFSDKLKLEDEKIDKLITSLTDASFTDDQIIYMVNIIYDHPEANAEFTLPSEDVPEDDPIVEAPGGVTLEDIERADRERAEREAHVYETYTPPEIPALDPVTPLDTAKLSDDRYQRILRIAEWLNEDEEDTTSEEKRVYVIRTLRESYGIKSAISSSYDGLNDKLEAIQRWWNPRVEEEHQLRTIEEVRLLINILCGVYPNDNPWQDRLDARREWEERDAARDKTYRDARQARQEAEAAAAAELERQRRAEEARRRAEEEAKKKKDEEESGDDDESDDDDDDDDKSDKEDEDGDKKKDDPKKKKDDKDDKKEEEEKKEEESATERLERMRREREGKGEKKVDTGGD